MTPINIDLAKELRPSESFNLIYTSLSFHHIIDTQKILTTFRQLLNPSGYLCIADFDEEDGSFHGEGFSGHNGFNRDNLTKMLEESGFIKIHSHICHEIIKEKSAGRKSYPIFAMFARKK